MVKKSNSTEQAAAIEQQPGIDIVPDNGQSVIEDGSSDDSVSAAEDNTSDKTEDLPVLSVVIPYISSVHSEVSLVASLRSLYKYFKESYNIVIIGDKPECLSDNVTHISYSGNMTQADIAEMIKLIIASDDVSDKFVLMFPDIFFIDYFSLAHLEIPKHKGKINPNRYDSDSRTVMTATAEYIVSNLEGIYPYDYNSHMPVVLEKDYLFELFEECPDVMNGELDLISIYFCAFAKHPILLDFTVDQWVLPVVSVSPDLKKVEKYATGKMAIWLKHVSNLDLIKDFLISDKCIFEV